MNFPAHLFPAAWSYAAFVPVAVALVWALRTAPWGRLATGPQLHVWPAAVVALGMLWSMRAGIEPGLDVHVLGAMVMVLAFGPQLALIGLALVLAAVTYNGAAEWGAYGLNALVMAVVPVTLARLIFRQVERWLPNHFFVYVFVTAFFGAAATLVAAGLSATVLLFAAGAYSAEHLLSNYLPYIALFSFSEAWLSGMTVTLLVVYRPTWVSTFDDARYLLDK